MSLYSILYRRLETWHSVIGSYDENKKIINDLAVTHFANFNAVSRKGNEESRIVIVEEGLEKISISDLTPFKKAGEDAKKEALGKLFDAELLKKVEALISEKRAK